MSDSCSPLFGRFEPLLTDADSLTKKQLRLTLTALELAEEGGITEGYLALLLVQILTTNKSPDGD